MIDRNQHIDRISGLLGQFPVVGIVGPRQVGKTTIARQLTESQNETVTWFDLENPVHVSRLAEPMLALQRLRGLIVIDEVQRMPDLFPTLRVLVDRPTRPARFIILGSASPHMLRQSSETLAGRIAYHELTGFTLDEIDRSGRDRLWLRGGFPLSYLGRSDTESMTWRQQFVRTFLERDLPQLGIQTPSSTVRRFWMMLAHYHGQVWNASELARSFGVAHTTIRRYLDTLTSTFVVRQLPAWRQNLRKRQVKAPKIYLSDSGLLHHLLRLETLDDLEGHPKVGASWEGFALQQVIHHLNAAPEDCFFWATHGGAELDLLVMQRGRPRGFEFKRTLSPRRTRSMTAALSDLQLETLDVVYPGPDTFPMGHKLRAVSIDELGEALPS